jgi:hypothetical protein
MIFKKVISITSDEVTNKLIGKIVFIINNSAVLFIDENIFRQSLANHTLKNITLSDLSCGIDYYNKLIERGILITEDIYFSDPDKPDSLFDIY